MAPEKPRLVFPRGGQLFKRGRRGRGKAEKSRGERNGTKRGERRNESVAVGSEPRGEGRPEGKTRSFLTGSEEPEGATGEEEKIGSSLCVRERERDKKRKGREKRREKKEKREKRREKEEKKEKKKKEHTPPPAGLDETHACDPMAFHTAILSVPLSPRFPSHLLIPAESFWCFFLSLCSALNDVIY